MARATGHARDGRRCCRHQGLRPAPPGRPGRAKGISMKACGVSGADGDVVLLELPDPPSPGPGQILVAGEAAGVGAWDQLLNGAGWDVGLQPPAALGVEGAGRVWAVVADVNEVAVG